jgi:hypothetical protein
VFVRTYDIVVMPLIILSVLLLTILYFKGRKIAEVPDAHDTPNPDDPDPADPLILIIQIIQPTQPSQEVEGHSIIFLASLWFDLCNYGYWCYYFMASSKDVLPPAYVLLVLNSFFAFSIFLYSRHVGRGCEDSGNGGCA